MITKIMCFSHTCVQCEEKVSYSNYRSVHAANGGCRVLIHVRVPRQRPQTGAHAPHRQVLSHADTSHASRTGGQPVRASWYWQDRVSEGTRGPIRETSARV